MAGLSRRAGVELSLRARRHVLISLTRAATYPSLHGSEIRALFLLPPTAPRKLAMGSMMRPHGSDPYRIAPGRPTRPSRPRPGHAFPPHLRSRSASRLLPTLLLRSQYFFPIPQYLFRLTVPRRLPPALSFTPKYILLIACLIACVFLPSCALDLSYPPIRAAWTHLVCKGK
jgi:hypothetical protein